jgi:hypothetical protein
MDGPLGRRSEYALAKDFCALFHQDMDVLYWLALTLTGDAGKAEQCFVSGLDECMAGNAVFKEWARSWSRRVVIKNAIRLTSPRPGTPSPQATRLQEKADSQAEVALATITHLRPFDRFVFVMSVLEGYPARDCATLLGCSPTDVVNARVRALLEMRRATDISPVPQGTDGRESQAPMVLSDAEVA